MVVVLLAGQLSPVARRVVRRELCSLFETIGLFKVDAESLKGRQDFVGLLRV